MTEAGVETEHRFPCPQCGADLRFDPAEGTLRCDHCGHTQALRHDRQAGEAIREIDFRRGLELALPDAEMETARYAKCPNCGAEVEFDPEVHATECPFCATPVVADTGSGRHIKPKGVTPFELTEAEARGAMTRWLGSLWFAPSGLVDYARKGRAMQGVYVPYWTFDAETESDYSGRRGDVHYESEPVRVRDSKGNVRTEMRQVAKVRWSPAAGRVSRFFDDVLVLASRSLPQSHTEALLPWDLTRLRPYQPEFLAGFRAEGYTVSLEEGMVEARTWMDRMIERDVRFDIGGDRQEIHRIDTRMLGVTFKHVLLPVWTAAYRFRGKSYRFVVNGQTGKVQGDRPWSALKIAVAALALAIAVGIGVFVAERQGAFDDLGATIEWVN